MEARMEVLAEKRKKTATEYWAISDRLTSD